MTVYISKDANDSELSHYGVMGMKWGVRKDPQRAVNRVNAQNAEWKAKASGLRAKRDSYISKHTGSRSASRQLIKADRLRAKANKKDLKGAKQSSRIFFRNEEAGYRNRNRAVVLRRRADKLQEKATGIDSKSNKMLFEAQGLETKAKRLEYATRKSLKSISTRETKRGERLLNRAFKQGAKINKAKIKLDANNPKHVKRLNKMADKQARLNKQGSESLAKAKRYSAAERKVKG